ncbi:hypothetical protein GQ44DRAFT_715579 [Phaeosphaeriaceae sp. PMI808]|nr:hypothetical protein GQ44DRAFT_715579 [Phaeosphaeriaceae sp. PMI808]
MATLLSLPREIRDQILRDAIYILRPLPASPSVSQDRIRLRNTFDPYWAHETKIYVERGLAGSAQMPLLWTNHQLRTETEELLKGLGVVSYRLDIMFVKECGILPTWLSFPNWRRHIDTVHAQVRIFNPPEGINSEWLKSAHFHGNGDGSIQTGWNIMFLLTVYLLNGFHDTTELYDGKATSDNEEAAYQSEENNIHIGTASGFHNKKIARYTIKAVILDVLEAPPTVHHATPGPADPPEGRQARRNAFGHSIFQLSDEQVSGHWPVPDGTGDLQVDPAHKLAFSLWRDITLGANMNFPFGQD